MVLSLERLLDIEDQQLLAGHLHVLLNKDYDKAQVGVPFLLSDTVTHSQKTHWRAYSSGSISRWSRGGQVDCARLTLAQINPVHLAFAVVIIAPVFAGCIHL